MKKITPFLWFDHQAEEAARFYTSLFNNSRIITTTYYNEASSAAAGVPEGSVMTVAFQLNGQDFVALNGGPHFDFTEAVSFVVNCETQDEIDTFWSKLSEGGSEGQCGWLKDKFGVSWQVVPSDIGELLSSDDPAKSEAATAALMTMKKINIDQLRQAHAKV
jgi:predicted 3-demethylubiquinone-9 3-methyltransferase (glyoxalase superfamily)